MRNSLPHPKTKNYSSLKDINDTIKRINQYILYTIKYKESINPQ